MSTKQDGTSLTARDLELLTAAFECTKEPIQVDYSKYAEKLGLKNAASAKASWHGLKKKLDKVGGGAIAPDEEGKKRKATDGDGNDDEVAAPAPKAAKKGRKAKAVKKEEAIKDEADDEASGL